MSLYTLLQLPFLICMYLKGTKCITFMCCQCYFQGSRRVGSIFAVFNGTASSKITQKNTLRAFLQVMRSTCVLTCAIVTHLFQIRLCQFENIWSHWSDPKPIDFIVLPKPLPVGEITVSLGRVDVKYNENGETTVEVDVTVAWPSIVVEHPVVFESYDLLINWGEKDNETFSTVRLWL